MNITAPSTPKALAIIAKFELIRLFFTKRGMMALGAFSIVWYFILRYPVNFSSTIIAKEEFQGMLRNVFGMVGVEQVLEWPVPELAIYWLISLFLFPLFSIFITSDQISSDRARGTLRFLVLRSTRSQIFIGRYLGQMLILASLVIGTLVATGGMALWRDTSLAPQLMTDSLLVFANIMLVLMPFVALMALTSVLSQSARSATFLAIIGIGAMAITAAVVSHYFPSITFLDDYLLGAQVIELASKYGIESFSLAGLPLAQTAVLLTLGHVSFSRSAL